MLQLGGNEEHTLDRYGNLARKERCGYLGFLENLDRWELMHLYKM
jgi:hypothetical protein